MKKILLVLSLLALFNMMQVSGSRSSGRNRNQATVPENNSTSQTSTETSNPTAEETDTTDDNSSTSTSTSSGSDLESVLLTLHNNIRSSLGISSLSWSSSLASSAQSWSDTMTSTGNFKHSGTDGVGENIAYGTARVYDASDLFGFWSSESKYYISGADYPDVSTTGSASDVGHYTQIIWGETTEVGCGLSESSSGLNYLTCQYSPQGNIIGEPVY